MTSLENKLTVFGKILSIVSVAFLVSGFVGKVYAGSQYSWCGGAGEGCCCTVTMTSPPSVTTCSVAGLPYTSQSFCDDPQGTDLYPLYCDETSTSPDYLKCVACTAEAGATCCPGDLCASPNTCNTSTGRCEGSCGHVGENCCVQYFSSVADYTCYSPATCEYDGVDYVCETGSIPCDEPQEPCCNSNPGGVPQLYCSGGLTCGADSLCKTGNCGDAEGSPCCTNAATGDPFCYGQLSCNETSGFCAMPCSHLGDACCSISTGHYYCAGDFYCDLNEVRCLFDPNIDEEEPGDCGELGQSCCDVVGGAVAPNPDDNHDGCRDPLLSVPWTDETSSGCSCQIEGACGGDFEYCCNSEAAPCDNSGTGCVNGVCIPGYGYLNNFTSYGGYTIPDVTSLLAPIFKILFYAGIAVGILAIILSGYLLMSSEGDPNKVKEAKEQFSASIFGIMFILLSLFLLRVIINNILGADLGF